MNFLYRLFPPPKYIDFPIVGLDISDRSFKFVEFKKTNDEYCLKRYGRKDIPKGLIEAGEIKKPEELSFLIASLTKPLGIKYIISALPEERALITMVELPSLPDEGMREAVAVEMEEKIPLSPKDAVFGFSTIKSPEKETNDVMVYAFPKTTVESYLGMYESAGLQPVAFEMETQALSRAVIPEHENGDVVMIVDFGRTRTSFVIIADGVVRYSSTVQVSGQSIDEAIAKALNISIAESERVKKEKGMGRGAEDGKVYDAVLPVVSAIRDEIERHTVFWNTHAEHVHKKPPNINRFILSGGDSNLIGLKEYLSQSLGLSVEHADVWVNASSFKECIPDIPFNQSLGYTAAIGLGLRAAKHGE